MRKIDHLCHPVALNVQVERRTFIKSSTMVVAASVLPQWTMQAEDHMNDIIIIGGSYSGLSAALALARARRNVLIIDANEPCNARVPHSHNLLTHDGEAPHVLRAKAIADVSKYPTVRLHNGRATEVSGKDGMFTVGTADGLEHRARKLLLALGVRDELPGIEGLEDCWGISAAACPFCHGYEVSDQRISIIGNAPDTFAYAQLVNNWSAQLNLFTNGPASFTVEQRSRLAEQGIDIIEEPIAEVHHDRGQVRTVRFRDGSTKKTDALFLRPHMIVPATLPEALGIGLTEQGLIKVDAMQRTSVPGVFASGDCTSPMRALAMAIAAGGVAGAVILHELVVGIEH